MAKRVDVELGGDDDRGADEVSPAFVAAFAASLPVAYRVLFDARAIRRHAGAAQRRAGATARVEMFRHIADGSAALCVIADDRPGLLALVAASLVARELDVSTAFVFSRPLDGGGREAVDLFWVRRVAPSHAPVSPADADAVEGMLTALLEGRASIDEVAPRASYAPAPCADASVRFEDHQGVAVLLVDAKDRPGMLLDVARVLHAEGAQIERSLVRTAAHRAHNRFEVTGTSGEPLAAERRARIREAVTHVLSGAGAEATGAAPSA